MSKIDLQQGDCLELMKGIPDESVDAIVTDPPYLYLKHKLDRGFDEQAVFAEWDRIVKDDGFIVIFGRGESFHRWNYLLNNLGWKFKEEVIWNKRYSSSPVLPISRMHETVSLLSKKGKVKKVKVPYMESKQYQLDRMKADFKRIISGLGNPKSLADMISFLDNGNYKITPNLEHKTKYGTTISASFKGVDRATETLKSMVVGQNEQSIIEVPRDGRKSIVHPTQKPARLMERLLGISSLEGALILDPFMGSGTTGVACVNTNRNFIGMEIDENYFKIAEQRIMEAKNDNTKK